MKISIVKGDGWEGLYCNDKLRFQDHRLDIGFVFRALQDEVIDLDQVYHADLDWLDSLGYLPDKLEDVKLEGYNKTIGETWEMLTKTRG